MLSALGPHPSIYFGIAAAAVGVVLITQRVPIVGSIVRLALTVGMVALLMALLAERAHVDPSLSRLATLLKLDDQTVTGGALRVPMSPDGHFWVVSRINGVERRMLVDSGATVTALSATSAAAAGVSSRASLFPIRLKTANGGIEARLGKVDDLRVGNIRAHDLAVVISPAFGQTDVLGMNFLSRLRSWRVEDELLILVPRRDRLDGEKS